MSEAPRASGMQCDVDSCGAVHGPAGSEDRGGEHPSHVSDTFRLGSRIRAPAGVAASAGRPRVRRPAGYRYRSIAIAIDIDCDTRIAIVTRDWRHVDPDARVDDLVRVRIDIRGSESTSNVMIILF